MTCVSFSQTTKYVLLERIDSIKSLIEVASKSPRLHPKSLNPVFGWLPWIDFIDVSEAPQVGGKVVVATHRVGGEAVEALFNFFMPDALTLPNLDRLSKAKREIELDWDVSWSKNPGYDLGVNATAEKNALNSAASALAEFNNELVGEECKLGNACYEETYFNKYKNKVAAVAARLPVLAESKVWIGKYGGGRDWFPGIGPYIEITVETLGTVQALADAMDGLNRELEYLAAGLNETIDCQGHEDDGGGGGENCDAIVDALNKLAEKDFGANCATKEDVAAVGSQVNTVSGQVSTVEGKVSELENKFEDIENAVGIGDFKEDGGWGFKVPKNILKESDGLIEIKSIPEFLSWHFKAMDALIGRFPQKIKINDADATTEGNQSVDVELPNLAETLAEMFGLVFTQQVNQEAILQTNLSALGDMASSKSMLAKTCHEVSAIVEFLGFATNEKTIDLPLPITLGKRRIDEAIQPSQNKVTVVELADDPTGYQQLYQIMNTCYAILKAAHVVPVSQSDPEGSLRDQFKWALEDTGEIDPATGQPKTPADDDFSAFTEQVETGFTNAPAIQDPSNPYGRKFEQRPKIRDIEIEGGEP